SLKKTYRQIDRKLSGSIAPNLCIQHKLCAETPFPGCPGSFLALADQPFLGDRSDEPAVARVDQAARKTERAFRVRRVLGVEQPRVGAKRAMKPERMIDAGALDRLFKHGAAMRDQRRVEQHQVGGISEHALMNCRVVGELLSRAHPDIEARLAML